MNSLQDYRYEKKFIVPYPQQHLIKKFIFTNQMRFIKEHEDRKVNSIYLDTNNLTLYKENIDGLSKRKKLRIRWYNDLKKDTNIYFEVKKKNNELGLKNIYKLDIKIENHHKENFLKKILSNIVSLDLDQEISSLICNVKPIIIITYERKYLISNICDCRMTIDTKLKYKIINHYANYIWDDYYNNQEMIIELKYPANIDKEIINKYFHFPFRVSKNSKYVNGINKYYPNNFLK